MSIDYVEVKKNIFEFLKTHVENFTGKRTAQGAIFTCPSCRYEEPTASFLPSNYSIICHRCNYRASIVELAVRLDRNVQGLDSEIKIKNYLTNTYNIKFEQVNSLILDFYEKNSFDLVPLVNNQKTPFEKDWINVEYRSREQWQKFIENNYNIGIKTGKKSNITVVDFDTKEVPDIFKKIADPLIQVSNRGYHYVFQYEESIATGKIPDKKIDILNDGKQFVVYPSKIDGVVRHWNFNSSDKKIPKMPEDIKNYILSFGNKRVNETSSEQKILEDVSSGKINSDNLKMIVEGSRNDSLVRFGGILRKQLNQKDTEFVLDILNKNFLKVPLSSKEMYTITNSLDRYIASDEKEVAKKIYQYLLYAEEGTSLDIEKAIQEKKDRVDKALAFLIKEQIVVKRSRAFHLIKKIEWREDFPNLINEVPFKVPYFDDIMFFNWGDLVILGGMPGYGKTTISMNFIKRFKDQNVKPYYICLETGSRFIKTATNLGLREGDFKWSIQTDPSKIEIEKNSVVILDWLMIEDKAMTDSVLKYFVEQLVKTNSFLIIFMQLKKNGEWFAPNMVDQFPAFAARYIYDEDSNGITGSWVVDKIREAKSQRRGGSIPCKYDWTSKQLLRIDELNKTESVNTAKAEEIVV